MANPLETGIRYVGSVAARSVGINAFRRWQRYAVEYFEPTSDAYRNRKGVGVFIGLIQFAAPATTDSVARAWSKYQFGTGEETNINPIIFMAKHSITPVADWASWMYLAGTDNFVQFALYKLAANAATHVGLDIISAGARGINRLRGFRPTPTTPAI